MKRNFEQKSEFDVMIVDMNFVISPNNQQTMVQLWGVDDDRVHYRLNVFGFFHYFYVLWDTEKRNQDAIARLATFINQYIKNMKKRSFNNSDNKYVKEIRVIKNVFKFYHTFQEKPQTFLKIVLFNHFDIPIATQACQLFDTNEKLVVYESERKIDIRFKTDTEIAPFRWITVTVPSNVFPKKDDSNTFVQYSLPNYLENIKIQPLEDSHYQKVAPLRILFFDIEVDNPAANFPKPEDPQTLISHISVISGILQNGLLNVDKNYILSVWTAENDDEPSEEIKQKELIEYLQYIEKQKESAAVVGETATFPRWFTFHNQKNLLHFFAMIFKQDIVDCISGYNINGFDIPFCANKAKLLNLESPIWNPFLSKTCQVKSKIFHRGNNQIESYECIHPGILNFDCMDYVKTFFANVLDRFSLNKVSKHFLGEEKYEMPYSIMHSLQSSFHGIVRIAAYCLRDTELVVRLSQKTSMFSTIIGKSRLCGISPYTVITGGLQKNLEVLLTQNFKKNKYIMDPFILSEKISYGGGLVLQPSTGFYKDDYIAVLDYNSLYPSIMIYGNMCHTTIIYPNHPNFKEYKKRGDLWKSPWVKNQDGKNDQDPILHATQLIKQYNVVDYDVSKEENDNEDPNQLYFVKPHVKKGILPSICEYLLTARRATQAELKKLQKELSEKENSGTLTPEEKQNFKNKISTYDGIQLAQKLVANGLYGYMGSSNAPFSFTPIAASVTAFGRLVLAETKIKIERDFPDIVKKVIYGDTDSVMILLCRSQPNFTLQDAFEKGNKLADYVNSLRNTLKVKLEKVGTHWLMIAKKCYIYNKHLDPNGQGKINFAGTCNIQKSTPKFYVQIADQVFKKMILDCHNCQEKDITQILHQHIKKIKTGEVNFYDLMTTNNYRTNVCIKGTQPHLEVVKKEKERGNYIPIGTKVSYINIGNGEAKKAMQAENPLYALDNDLSLNFDHYIQKLKTYLIKPLHVRFRKSPSDSQEITWKRIFPQNVSSSSSSSHYHHTIPPYSFDNREKTGSYITKYINKSLLCKYCNSNTSNYFYICNQCLSKPENQTIASDLKLSLQTLHQEHQNAYNNCKSHCEKCQPQDWVNCQSIDCSILYERKSISKKFNFIEKRIDYCKTNHLLEW